MVGYQSGDVRLWSLIKEKEISKAKELHSSPVSEVKFCHEGHKIITASSDDMIKIIDINTMKTSSTIHILD